MREMKKFGVAIASNFEAKSDGTRAKILYLKA